MPSRIDLTGSPPPTPSPLVTFLTAIAAGAFFGFVALFPAGLFMAAISIVFPLLSPSSLAEQLRVSDSEFTWRYVYPATATIGVALFLCLFLNHYWRIPGYGLRMGELSARLRRFRNRLPGNGNRGHAWGALNLGLPIVSFAVLMTLDETSGFPRAMLIIIGLVLLATPLFLLNGARLIAGGSSLSRVVVAIAMRAAPYLAFSASLFVGIFLFVLLSDMLRVSGAALLSAIASLVVAFGIAVVLLSRLQAGLKQRADALTLPRAKEALWADRRRPVLFLRSFKDDGKGVSGSLAGESEDQTLARRLEDVLAGVAGRYGPLIAVGEPGVLPTTGAARAYYQGDDWRQAVLEWMDQALFILMVAGFTEGVRWELDNALLRGHAKKLILIFPPNDANFEARWQWTKDRLQASSLPLKMNLTASKDYQIMHWDEQGEEVVLASRHPNVASYKAALALAIYGIFLKPGDTRLLQ